MSLPHERQAVLSLALLYIFRMLGLFMVLPVLALSGAHYEGSSPFLLGIALGVYGISQALLQVPFGSLSDRFGRKPLIAFGLLLFAAGSIVAASAETIEGLIAGRMLQGAGAIAGVIMAMVGDLTSTQGRTKAMASIGASIGIAFAVALVIGPLIASFGGVSTIFWVTALLAISGLVVLYSWVPNPVLNHGSGLAQNEAPKATIRSLLFDRQLLPLNVGIFTLHCVLMAMFVILPLILLDSLAIAQANHSWVYLGLLCSAFIAMVPMMIIAERKGLVKPFVLISILSLSIALLALAWQFDHRIWVLFFVWVFFVGFNYLEASLPSLMSKTVPAASKGAGSGLFSTCQFLGAALGGVMGGWLYAHYSFTGVLLGCTLLVILWLMVALGMKIPSKLSRFCVPLKGQDYGQLAPELLALPGVEETIYSREEDAAYLTIDRQRFDQAQLTTMGLG